MQEEAPKASQGVPDQPDLGLGKAKPKTKGKAKGKSKGQASDELVVQIAYLSVTQEYDIIVLMVIKATRVGVTIGTHVHMLIAPFRLSRICLCTPAFL